MPHTKNEKDPVSESGTQEFDLGALTDKYSVSSDVDLAGVESLFRELSGEKQKNAETQKKEPADEKNIDDIVNEFEKTMPKYDRPRHSPKVIYSEDGGFSDEKKPVVLKRNAESRVSVGVQKKEPSRPAAGIPIGRKKNASSRVIFSADEESVKNEEKKDEIKITADTSVDSKPAAEAVVISKKHAVNKHETDISGKTEKDGVKKNGGTYVLDEKTEKKESERRTSDIDDFADVLNGIESENGKSDHSDDVSSVKNKKTVKPSDKKNSENKKNDSNSKNADDNSADEFFDDVEEVKIESLDPSGNNVFTEADMLLYEKERNKALGKKDAKGAFKRFVRAVIPQKGDAPGEIARKIILIVSALTILVCAVWFGNYYLQHFNEKDELKKLGTEVTTDPDADLAAQWAKIKAEFPDVDFPDGMNIKYARAYAVNQDMVGKLKIPGTAIDIPIVQCKDDTNDYQYYLKHSFQKKDSKYGTPFMSAECDPFNLGDTTVIHGHNMYDNLMFADLEKYYKIEGYKESPIIQYNTLFKDYEWKIFAIIITNGSASGDNGYVFDFTVPSFGSKQNKADFINGLLERSIYNIDVDVNADDKLLVLNTCCYVFNGAHLGVAARMVRPGENTSVDVSKATVNEDARYPQAWYDAKNLPNPYKDAYRWHQTG
ncbi:MAG: sortase [Oscillospiraceae bacterium]|nr:sortase [Oscillospiraceae bacterium]